MAIGLVNWLELVPVIPRIFRHKNSTPFGFGDNVTQWGGFAAIVTVMNLDMPT
jgi:hypothetical protein